MIKLTSKFLQSSFVLRTEKGSPIKRSPLGVGKLIGGDLYLHRSYASELPDQEGYREALSLIPTFPFNIIKVGKEGSYTFFNSPDFDTADEPTAGQYVRISAEGTMKTGESKSIWHHKWLWVKDDYPGFDVEASKERSAKWLQIPGIDFNRIGNKGFWETHVVPLIH